MGTRDLFRFFKRANGVSIDSRTIQQGAMFFAIKGPNFDGHAYVESAIAKGASFAVIDNPEYHHKDKTILVKDTTLAIQNLARYYRSTLQIPIIGITGSNGKTTTKELMYAVLSTRYSTFATKGNLNNHFGVPISVLSIKDDHEIAVIEMGANSQGEIKFLSEIAMPDFGLITNIGKAHLEGFGGLEGVRKGKTELYRYLDKTRGTIFYDSESDLLVESLPDNTTNIPYAKNQAEVVSKYPQIDIRVDQEMIRTNLVGEYNVINVIAALTIGTHFEVTNSQMINGIQSYKPSNNRSEIRKTKDNELIMDAYNANPSSMIESIKNFKDYPVKHKTLILGHMLEVGENSADEHRSLVDFISKFKWDNVFLVGREFFNLKEDIPFQVFLNTEELGAELMNLSIKGHAILLKGSRGIALERCAQYL